MCRVGIGQDSHRFSKEGRCILGGVYFEGMPALEADSDGDVVFHAICNAISSISGAPILGKVAPDLCKNKGITDSAVYVQEALKTLKGKIVHVAISLEGKRPYFQGKIEEMKRSIASSLNIEENNVGITTTSGDGLTAFARGEGVQCFCIVTVEDQ